MKRSIFGSYTLSFFLPLSLPSPPLSLMRMIQSMRFALSTIPTTLTYLQVICPMFQLSCDVHAGMLVPLWAFFFFFFRKKSMFECQMVISVFLIAAV